MPLRGRPRTHEELSEYARRAAEALRDKRGVDYFRQLGRKGGKAAGPEAGERHAKAGSEGGKTTAKRYGDEYMRTLGRRGAFNQSHEDHVRAGKASGASLVAKAGPEHFRRAKLAAMANEKPIPHLEALRESAALTRRELAERSGVNDATIRLAEKQPLRRVRPFVRARLAAALGVNESDLTG
jgi:DNA-binding XRE family transcriptional regulator